MKDKIVLDFNSYVVLRIVQISALAKKRLGESDNDMVSSTAEQLAILLITSLLGKEATPYRISKYLAAEPHTVSSAISTMEKSGMITKVKDMPKKNMVRINITKKGHQILKNAKPSNITTGMLSELSDKERDSLVTALDKILGTILKSAYLHNKHLDVWAYK